MIFFGKHWIIGTDLPSSDVNGASPYRKAEQISMMSNQLYGFSKH